MSHTFSFDHTPSTQESVLIEVAPKSELTYRKTTTDPKTGEVAAEYVLASGDDAYPGLVTFRSSVQSRSNGMKRVISVTFSTWAVDANSVSGIDTRSQAVGTISLLLPAEFTIELADLMQFVGNLFSFTYASQASGVRSTGYLQNLLYGVTKVI